MKINQGDPHTEQSLLYMQIVTMKKIQREF